MNPPSGRALRALTASAALLALSGLTVGSLSSSALFTDAVVSPEATVTSGSVTLSLQGTAATSLSVSSMAPGDSRFGVVSVASAGSLQSRYSARAVWSAPNALTEVMTLSVRTIATADARCDATLGWGTGDLSTTQAAGAQSALVLFGDRATGPQAGDRVLDAATTEHLCVRMSLPSSAGNAVAGLTSGLRLEFDSEQTAHNS